MAAALVREYDKRLWKKCIKCRGWHPREDILDDDNNVVRKHGFGKHEDSSDGLQSICFFCKNRMNTKSRAKNVVQRVRHHTGTRCLTQLGKPHTPPNFVANLEDYLGYKITTLVKALSKDLKEREGNKRKLRDALNEGYHIDHVKPLSSFAVIGNIGVDWDEFRECWAISNLRAIPADENLAKGATYDEAQGTNGEEGTEGKGKAQEGEAVTSEEVDKGNVNIDISGSL